MKLKRWMDPQTRLPHLSPFKFPWHFHDKITVFPDNFYYFSIIKKTTSNCYYNSPTHPGFLKFKNLTVIISRPWVYIFQADIYINTTQLEPLLYDGSFNLKIISRQNFQTIPWHDITIFPDMGQMAKIPWHSFTIPWPGENFVFPWLFPHIWQPCPRIRALTTLTNFSHSFC